MNDIVLLTKAREAAANGGARRRRIKARLSQAEVAEDVGVTRTAVSLWERGLRRPRGQAALRYARLLATLEPN